MKFAGSEGGLRECAGEVVCRNLVRGNESFFDEVLVPLAENIVVLGKVGVVVRSLSIG